jgi:hypothetical protein
MNIRDLAALKPGVCVRIKRDSGGRQMSGSEDGLPQIHEGTIIETPSWNKHREPVLRYTWALFDGEGTVELREHLIHAREIDSVLSEEGAYLTVDRQ